MPSRRRKANVPGCVRWWAPTWSRPDCSPARVLFKANQWEGGPGRSDAAIADAVDVHPDTVARVRRAYVSDG